MNLSSQVSAILLFILLIQFNYSNSFAKTKKNKPDPTVFSIWEYAKVAGPRRRPSVPAQAQAAPPDRKSSTISPCVWAIASCCHSENLGRRDACFEALGCGGAWFNNLCSTKLQESALKLISKQ
ncbi:hypothetical protein Avbf_11255 [Armadillidium vulgare]|nr:hypothetical protein Avbf_11255 [Armadillidium vulgare]